MLAHKIGDLHFLSYKRFEPVRNIVNIVTTREGGRSEGPHAALNLGLHVGEDPDVTLENRALIAMGIGFEPEHLTVAQQVHGAEIAVVTSAERGAGAIVTDDAIAGADALITAAPDVPLMVMIADCVAISLYDPNKRVIAIVHAGWRGTVARIAEKTVAKMTSEMGTDPSEVLAGISPSIGPGHYDVGHDVHEQFIKEFGRRDFVQEDMDGTCYLDLWGANMHQLENVGVKPENMTNAEICTACDLKRFYSHRYENGNTGRFAAVMMIRGSGDRHY